MPDLRDIRNLQGRRAQTWIQLRLEKIRVLVM